jgi:hypothetical protein
MMYGGVILDLVNDPVPTEKLEDVIERGTLLRLLGFISTQLQLANDLGLS